VQAAADNFRDRHRVLTADELEEWLERSDVSVEEWNGEMLPAVHRRAEETVIKLACCRGQLPPELA
jgi:dsDNA-binding SOS-regulon protein